MAQPPLRRLVTAIAFEVTGESAANEAVNRVKRNMQSIGTMQDRQRAREEAAQRRQERDDARAYAAAERNAIRAEAAREKSINAQLKLLDRQSKAQARLDRQADREAAQERARQERANGTRMQMAAREAARKAAVEEKSIRDQLRLMDRQSKAQARLDRQQAREEEAAARKRLQELRATQQEAARVEARAAAVARDNARAFERAERDKQRAIERTTRALHREQEQQERANHRSAHGTMHGIGHVGMLLGLAYSGHELIHMADEWAFITATVKNSTQSVNDYTNAMQRLFGIAQSAGVGVEAPLRLFNQLSSNSKETGLSQNDILGITDTVTRGIALNHGTSAQNNRAMRQFDEMLSMGKLSRQHMNSLRVDNPYLANIMAQVSGGQSHLDAAIHGGKANMAFIIDMVHKMRAVVDHDFGNVQTTFAMAYQRIRNTLMRLMGEFIIENRTISTGLNFITGAVDKLASWIEKAAKAVGGFSQATHIAAIMLAAAFGPAAITALVAFGAALAPLILPWAAMAAGIAAVLLLLDDLYAWIQGRDSIAGRLFGDFAQYRKQIADIGHEIMHAFGLDHALDNVHSLRDVFKGILNSIQMMAKDPTTHWKLVSDLHEALSTIMKMVKAVEYIAGITEKLDPLSNVSAKGTANWVYNHLPDQNTLRRWGNNMSLFGMTPLYPAATGSPTHAHTTIDASVVINLGNGAQVSPHEVANAVTNSQRRMFEQNGYRGLWGQRSPSFTLGEAGLGTQ